MTGFNPTHRLKGSGYELRHVDGVTYRDATGNTLSVGHAAVERIMLSTPAGGTLWRDLNTGDVYVYSSERQEFFALETSDDRIPVEEYENGNRSLTQMFPYPESYPAGSLFQDIFNDFSDDNKPWFEIYSEHGQVKVVLHANNSRTLWTGSGETVEKAASSLAINMID